MPGEAVRERPERALAPERGQRAPQVLGELREDLARIALVADDGRQEAEELLPVRAQRDRGGGVEIAVLESARDVGLDVGQARVPRTAL